MKLKRPELLSPGGSGEGIRACICAGADAVYAGGSMFGARAYANNPDENEMLDAIEMCHLNGKKLYLTVNTLLREDELEHRLYDYLLPYYEKGLDAVLVQDLGVLSFIKDHFPGLDIHASTQMSISCADGAAMMKELGCTRIVPARELSLEEIEKIHRSVDIEIETFAHGALCFCYSGQCLMSSMIGGRSGNRGRCAQPCRQLYSLDNGKPQYRLSLKDINTLKILPLILRAGVTSLKLEGRMKRTEYAAGVTAIYRKYLDRAVRFLENGDDLGNWRVEEEDERILMDLYNRGGFSTGYYQIPKGAEMMTPGRPNHAGTKAFEVAAADRSQVRLKALEAVREGDAIEVYDRNGAGSDEIIMSRSLRRGEVCTMPAKGALKKLRAGQVLRRVRSEKLLEQIRSDFVTGNPAVKIKGKFIFRRGEAITLELEHPAASVTVSGEVPQEALSRPLARHDLERQLLKTGGTDMVFENLDISCEDGLFLPMGEIAALRREGLEKLREAILLPYERKAPEEKTAVLSEAEGEETDALSDKVSITAWVTTKEQLRAVLTCEKIGRICLDSTRYMPPAPALGRRRAAEGDVQAYRKEFCADAHMIRSAGKVCLLALPNVWREQAVNAFETVFDEETLNLADVLVLRNLQQLYSCRERYPGKKMLAGQEIYSWNARARRMIRSFGASDMVSAELNRQQILPGSGGMVIYGRTLLMTTAQCLGLNEEKCTGRDSFMTMTDRTKAVFPVRRCCGVCSNLIYNGAILDLTGNAREVLSCGCSSLHIQFTTEDEDRVKKTAAKVCAAFLGDGPAPLKETGTREGTRGHFKRGVE